MQCNEWSLGWIYIFIKSINLFSLEIWFQTPLNTFIWRYNLHVFLYILKKYNIFIDCLLKTTNFICTKITFFLWMSINVPIARWQNQYTESLVLIVSSFFFQHTFNDLYTGRNFITFCITFISVIKTKFSSPP